MAVTIAVVVALVIMAAVLVAARSRRVVPQGAAQPAPSVEGRLARVALDVDPGTRDTDATRRLVAEAARDTFARAPDADEVEVVARGGAVLARVRRTAEQRPLLELPVTLLEPAPHRVHAPVVHTEDTPFRPVTARFEDEVRAPKPLAEVFELADAVRARLRAPADAAAIVRAILEAGGHAVERTDEDILRCADVAVIVLGVPIGDAVSAEALNHAYLLFTRSGAARGVVLTPGLLNAHDVRRRELLAPRLLHAGAEAIQRMADAVAAGADPLPFAAALPIQAS
jgi:hypothetical protein